MDWAKVFNLLNFRTNHNLETGCWEYQGVNSSGYGQIQIDGTFYYVHRLSMMIQLKSESIPDNLHTLHKCNNRCCWNPEHLYLGTNDDNIDDMVRAGRGRSGNSDKTHCKHGHEFTPANTYYCMGSHGERRQCRTCKAILDKERKERKRLKIVS